MKKVSCLTSYTDAPEDPLHKPLHRGDQVEVRVKVNGQTEPRRGQIVTLGTRTANVQLEGRAMPVLVYLSELRRVDAH